MSFPLVVGVDISTARVAFADTSGRANSILLTKERDGQALFETYQQSLIASRQFAGQTKPVAVFIEVPTGKYPAPYLMQTVGAVAAGVYSGLKDTQAHPVPVWHIAVKQWKKYAIGNGNAGKGEIAQWADNLDLSYANQDECDALGIAFGGYEWMLDKAEAA